tara:strand:- start:56 stop:952 length:897 start_codon:yes stop_codon:yes gene_type:complete
MIELWIPITILAAFSQNLRSAFQKKLQGKLSGMGATYVRFSYGLPFVFIYFLLLNYNSNSILLTNLNFTFFTYCLLGGISQILATFLLLKMFLRNNFAVGTAYSKTEPIQAAFFSLIILNETISFIGLIGIIVGLIGVLIISYNRNSFNYSFFNRSVLLGLLSGTLFGVSAVFFRGASHSLKTSDYVLSSSFTLLVVIFIQTLLVTIYLLSTDKKQLFLTLINWKESIIVGFFGALASLCWFYAMSIQNVAYVRALGQIELLFTICVSILYFKEKIYSNEIIGIIITLAGLYLILIYS